MGTRSTRRISSHTKPITMQTQEQILGNIVAIMDNYINKGIKYSMPTSTLDKIQTLLEEEYIHGSLDNEYK